MSAATDLYSDRTIGLDSPAIGVALVSPSDTTDLSFVTRGISFGTAGAIQIITANGNQVIIPSGALAAGIIHPIRASRVLNTGTTAAAIVGWW